MPNRLFYEDIKNIINKEDTLLSLDYVNNKQLLDIKCGKCNQIYHQCYRRYQQGHRHNKCPINQSNYSEMGKKAATKRYNLSHDRLLVKETQKECLICNNIFFLNRRKQYLCSRQCANIFTKTNKIFKDNAKLNGSKGGVISAAKQQRRSKAEILFAEYCKDFFGNDDILCNVAIYKDKNGNFWDADITIKSLKIAILYDGIWHYKQVNKNHKLEQVQSRDVLKRKIIEDNGYNYYTVVDMGKFNKEFVWNEFIKFIHQL